MNMNMFKREAKCSVLCRWICDCVFMGIYMLYIYMHIVYTSIYGIDIQDHDAHKCKYFEE